MAEKLAGMEVAIAGVGKGRRGIGGGAVAKRNVGMNGCERKVPRQVQ